MPHLSIEYSANLESEVDMAALCDCLREATVQNEEFPLAGTRVRAYAADHSSVADGDPKHGFIDVSVRIRAGRSMEVRKDAIQRIYEAGRKFLQPVLDRRSLSFSLELREIDPELSPKTDSTRDHLKG